MALAGSDGRAEERLRVSGKEMGKARLPMPDALAGYLESISAALERAVFDVKGLAGCRADIDDAIVAPRLCAV